MDYKSILNNLPMIIFVKSVTSTLSPIFYNKEWYDYTGVDPALVENSWVAVVHPDDVGRVRKEVLDATVKQIPYEIEVRIFNITTQTYRWCLSKAKPVKDNEVLSLWVGVIIDIHDRKASLEHLEVEYATKIGSRTKRIHELEEELHKTGV